MVRTRRGPARGRGAMSATRDERLRMQRSLTQSIADVTGVAGLVLLVLAVLGPEPGYGRLGLGLVIFGGFLRLRRADPVGVSDHADSPRR